MSVATEPAVDRAAVRLHVKLGLTERQAEVYLFIFESSRSRGFQPAIREVGAAFGMSSPNAVVMHLKVLAAKGWLGMSGGSSRAIHFMRKPGGGKFRGFSAL